MKRYKNYNKMSENNKKEQNDAIDMTQIINSCFVPFLIYIFKIHIFKSSRYKSMYQAHNLILTVINRTKMRPGAPTQRISKRNSTDNASWRGPNIEAGQQSAFNNVKVGVRAPTQKLANSQLSIMCKLAGPQHRSWPIVSFQ